MKIMLALALVLLSAGAAAQAREQREDCNRKAEGYSGEERTRIITSCARRNATTVTSVPPRLARMTECNQQAGNMTGDARVKFVNDCMDAP